MKLDQVATFIDQCTFQHNSDSALFAWLPSANTFARITNNTLDDNGTPVMYISAGGSLVISDNTIANSRRHPIGGSNNGFGIRLDSGTSNPLALTLTDNTITGSPHHGLLLRSGLSAITGSITDNSFNNNSGYGIVVSDDSSNASSASSITIERNNFIGNSFGGVALGANLDSNSPAATITLDDNVIHNNQGSGVVIGLWDSFHDGLSKPGSSQCSGAPIALHHIIVSNNTITQNTGRSSTNDDGVQGSAIFHCFNGKATITGNRIHDNGSSSAQSTIWFHLHNTTGEVTFQRNQVSGNEATSATLFQNYGPGVPSISFNAFHDNDAPNDFRPHQNQTNNLINLENNWWGANSEALAESRIFHKNDDITFADVDFIPILTAPPTSTPPAPPTSLAAQTGPTTIALTWDANPEADIAGYKVHYDTDAAGYPYASSTDTSNATAHTLSGLSTATTYFTAVSAYDSDGNESWLSSDVAVATLNTSPTASGASASVAEDSSVIITMTGSDADGEPLIFTIVSLPSHGSLGALDQVDSTTASTIYTPGLNFDGADFFTFRVSDGDQFSSSATVLITVNPVNDQPAATPVNVSTVEDTSTSITLEGNDPEGDPLTFDIVTPPQHGTIGSLSVTGTTTATGTYTPAANFNGSDSFTFRVNDGLVDSVSATVSISVQSANDTPVADPQSVSTAEDTVLTVTLTGGDIDGDAFTFNIAANPSHGSVSAIVFTGSTTATVDYTPTPNYHGSDSFLFTTNDGLTVTLRPLSASLCLQSMTDRRLTPTACRSTRIGPSRSP